MATTKQMPRSLRTLIVLAIMIFLAFGALLAGTRWSNATLAPNLALDLEGGTQIILTPVTTDGSQVTDADIAEAIEIIRQRVDSSGVAEAEIASQGGNNIVVGLPGAKPDEETLELVRRSAQMNFRPVLHVESSFDQLQNMSPEELEELGIEIEDPDAPGASAPEEGDDSVPAEESDAGDDGTDGADSEDAESESTNSEPLTGEATFSSIAHPTDVSEDAANEETDGTDSDEGSEDTDVPFGPGPADPNNPSDLAQVTPEVQEDFEDLNCMTDEALKGGISGDPNNVLVTCQDDGSAKYILGPVEIPGTEIARASSGLSQQGQVTTNEWVVNIEFTKDGASKFSETTRRLADLGQQANLGQPVAPNLFAMALDGLVISAPSVEEAIPNGQAEISGTFDRDSAARLANQLNFGALPLSFEVQSEQEISATLGSEQLKKGLIAGSIGLLLVVIYSLFQYRVLGLVTVASLTIAALITYAAIAILSWTQGYRLSLPGVAGVIVAIGITADSFIVYFERIRDELRDGRTLSSAIDKGWDRAKRTILASDTVNFLAAIVLYFLAVGGVRGFAFTLGLTTLVDLIVVFLFTHPLLKLIARTSFFEHGHPWSGLDPRRLGVRSARYVGRGRVATATGPGTTTEPSAGEPAQVREPAMAGAPSVAADGRKLTIAERRAAAARAAEAAVGQESTGAPPGDAPASAGTEQEPAGGAVTDPEHEENL